MSTNDQMIQSNVVPPIFKKDEHPKKLESSQRQDLIVSIWKVIIAIGVVVVFDVIVFSIVPRQKYLIDFGFRTRANYFDFEQSEKVDTINEIWEILRIGDPKHIMSKALKLNSPLKEIGIMTLGKHCLI